MEEQHLILCEDLDSASRTVVGCEHGESWGNLTKGDYPADSYGYFFMQLLKSSEN